MPNWLIHTMIVLWLTIGVIGPALADETAPASLVNQLKNHPSPYLAMHGDDPVAWQTWSEDVLTLARNTNKMIFVSIGYFSCHWCHVMQRESYKDPDVAGRLNADFIPVKIDRELAPALDAYLIDFVQKTRGYAGWPLNVFLTPEGYPVIGMVYVPKDPFRKVLVQLADLWQKDAVDLRQTAVQAAAQQLSAPIAVEAKLQPGIGETLYNQLLHSILQAANDIQGGFGNQAKFPMTAQLNFLLFAYQRQPTSQIEHFLRLTLEQMATQAMRDHVGGGFFRYTVDPDWQTPHFEKMLYDNAQLAALYIDAARLFKRRDFEAVGRETLDFMLREMSAGNGAMVSSLSAVDKNRVEGGYYLWKRDTLQRLLSAKEWAVVKEVWRLDRPSAFDAGYLPMQGMAPDLAAEKLGLDVETVMGILANAQGKLFAVRKHRSLPVDNKQLASWNGLALAALVKGAQLPGGEKYQRAAQQVRDFLVKQLWDGHRLVRAKRGSQSLAKAGLEDYAYAAQGLLQWASLRGQKEDLQLTKQWLLVAWQRFYSSTGWRLADDISLPGFFGHLALEDNPMPSPSASLIQTSLQLAALTGEEDLRQRALTALAASQQLVKTAPFAYATQVQTIVQYESQQHHPGAASPAVHGAETAEIP